MRASFLLLALGLAGCASLRSDAPGSCVAPTTMARPLVVDLMSGPEGQAYRALYKLPVISEQRIRSLQDSSKADRRACMAFRNRFQAYPVDLNSFEFYAVGPYYAIVRKPEGQRALADSFYGIPQEVTDRYYRFEALGLLDHNRRPLVGFAASPIGLRRFGAPTRVPLSRTAPQTVWN